MSIRTATLTTANHPDVLQSGIQKSNQDNSSNPNENRWNAGIDVSLVEPPRRSNLDLPHEKSRVSAEADSDKTESHFIGDEDSVVSTASSSTSDEHSFESNNYQVAKKVTREMATPIPNKNSPALPPTLSENNKRRIGTAVCLVVGLALTATGGYIIFNNSSQDESNQNQSDWEKWGLPFLGSSSLAFGSLATIISCVLLCCGVGIKVKCSIEA